MWEYLIVTVESEGRLAKITFFPAIVHAQMGDVLPEPFAALLNELGATGWELVSDVEPYAGYARMIFKRNIAP